MFSEDLARVGGQGGQGDHGGEDDVAELGGDVVPGVGDALARVLADGAGDGLGHFAGFLGDLHDAQEAFCVRRQRAMGVEPVHDLADAVPRGVHDRAG